MRDILLKIAKKANAIMLKNEHSNLPTPLGEMLISITL
jgi:hypothetical protein